MFPRSQVKHAIITAYLTFSLSGAERHQRPSSIQDGAKILQNVANESGRSFVVHQEFFVSDVALATTSQ